MDIGKAKEYFGLGLIQAAVVRSSSILHNGWTIELSGNIGSAQPTLHTARGEVRQFKTLDAAAKVVREIGLREWRVITD
ncbi:hypothetical protein BK247_26585 [Escherichia coli]|nr:hypothetical protein BK247_26585 [Escherichia coli]